MTLIDPRDLAALARLTVHVLGYISAEGAAAATFLSARGCTRLVLHDYGPAPEARARFDKAHAMLDEHERQRRWDNLAALEAPRRHEREYLSGIAPRDVLFLGQNWFQYEANHPGVDRALEAGARSLGLIDLYLAQAPGLTVGVTGTNGKTTTVELIAHLLGRTRRALIGGNDVMAPQTLHELGTLGPGDAVVLEISNRQLRALALRPRIAVLTNVAPDHIGEHGSLAGYAACKRKLVEGAQVAVLNLDDPIVREFRSACGGRVLGYTREARLPPGWDGLAADERTLPWRRAWPLPGAHNLSNLLAALTALQAAEALAPSSSAHLERDLADFRGVKHRQQLVLDEGGLRFIDDLASTSPAALLEALETWGPAVAPKGIHLIAGGDAKGGDFTILRPAFARHLASLQLLQGTGTASIAEQATTVTPRGHADLASAVKAAITGARPGQIVLMSPGGAFFKRMYVEGRPSLEEHARRCLAAGQGTSRNAATAAGPRG